MSELTHFDVIVLGAGGAGMMCASTAGARGRRVLVLDHGPKLGAKILISGGGRCNFTNTGASPKNYVSQNPHFVKSALSRFPSSRFIEKVEARQIPYHEKKLGQLFCDRSAQDIVNLLKSECDDTGVTIRLNTKIENVRALQSAGTSSARFEINHQWTCESLVIATGGLSIPKIGASGFGYAVARQFGLAVVETAPALDGFVFLPGNPHSKLSFSALSGISIDCTLEAGGLTFRENVLFTHTGLSGPAALQASLHWRLKKTSDSESPPESISMNILPDLNLFEVLMSKKREGSRRTLPALLSELLPARFAEAFSGAYFESPLPLPQLSEKKLREFCDRAHAWKLTPDSTVGYSKAEVTRGGVDTNELSSKTLESKKVPGLYFIGEVVDVTGWLGGYNFQWAWASGWAAGQVV